MIFKEKGGLPGVAWVVPLLTPKLSNRGSDLANMPCTARGIFFRTIPSISSFFMEGTMRSTKEKRLDYLAAILSIFSYLGSIALAPNTRSKVWRLLSGLSSRS